MENNGEESVGDGYEDVLRVVNGPRYGKTEAMSNGMLWEMKMS